MKTDTFKFYKMQCEKKQKLRYQELGFEHRKVADSTGKVKYLVICIRCSTELKNTSVSRMKQHRDCCNGVKKITDGNKYVGQSIIYPETEHRLGRHLGKIYGLLGFKPGKIQADNGIFRSIALCLVCNKNMRNTSESRLACHRRICNSEEYPSPEQIKSTELEDGYIEEKNLIDESEEDLNCVNKKHLKKSSIPKSSVISGYSFRKFCQKLKFKLCKFKSKSGLVQDTAVCLDCNIHFKPRTRAKLLVHRKICQSEYDISAKIQQPRKGGRNCSELYSELGFKCRKLKNSNGNFRNVATCLVCNKHLRNTAGVRLLAHRRVCGSEKYNYWPVEEIFIETENIEEENQIFDENKPDVADQYPEINGDQVFIETLVKEERPSVELDYVPRKRSETPDLNLTDVKEAIANFIYGCNLPFSITESVHFERLIRSLDASCLNDIPRAHELSHDVLTETYKKYLEETKFNWRQNEASLVLDTVKSKEGQRFYVSVLQDGATGMCAFVNCSSLGNHLDNEDNFNKMVTESIELAKVLYNADVYAIVTDRLVRSDNPESFTNIWYLPCHRYLASLILRDLLATLDFKTCLYKVKIIVDEVKSVEFSEPLTYRNTDLGREVDNLYFLFENWKVLEREAFANSQCGLSNDVRLVLCSSDFRNTCKKCIEKIDFLSGFMNKLTARTYSLADSLVLWQNFVQDPMVQESTDVFKLIVLERFKETNNVYSLVTRYFGGSWTSDFSTEENKKIADFFHKVLSKEGFEEYIRFIHSLVLGASDRGSANFWNLMKNDFPNFAEFALQMLRIPGSSILRGIFKNFSQDCKNVNKEQLRMLAAVYFGLNGFGKETDLRVMFNK